jgi:hypothetical protein
MLRPCAVPERNPMAFVRFLKGPGAFEIDSNIFVDRGRISFL